MRAMRITKFESEGTAHKLKEPIVFTPFCEGGMVCADLGIFGYHFAYSPKFLRRLIIEHFDFLWSVYIPARDEEMTPQARELKRKLLEIVK